MIKALPAVRSDTKDHGSGISRCWRGLEEAVPGRRIGKDRTGMLGAESSPVEGPTSGQFGIIVYKKTTMGPYTYPNLMQFPSASSCSISTSSDTRFTSEEVDVSSLDLTSAQSLVPYVTKENLGDLCGGRRFV
uniref:Uncharacterized protein n=1 Tax=Peronospora matthiolae TaxID=2874970 RepID=A0AAV1UNU4_9STRA